MQFKVLQNLLEKELSLTKQAIKTILNTDVGLLNNIFAHLLSAKSKQIRPICALLSGHLSGYQASLHPPHAAIIEIIHSATLLHDDVVDGANLRRNQATAHQLWGNAPAILTGDFLYSKAFSALLQLGCLQSMKKLANATSTMAEGEALQLSFQHNLALTEKTYFRIIQAKTAKLFEATTEVSAILAKAPPQKQQALKQYGFHLGTAFQLMDDLLDYHNPPNRHKDTLKDNTGKQLGNDILEGKITLPIIYFLQSNCTSQIKKFKNFFTNKAVKNELPNYFPTLQTDLQASGAIAYTRNKAKEHIQKANQSLTIFKKNAYWEASVELAEFVVNRIC